MAKKNKNDRTIKKIQKDLKIPTGVVTWLERVVVEDYNQTVDNYVISQIGEESFNNSTNADEIETIKQDYKAGFETGFWSCVDALKLDFNKDIEGK